MTGFPLGAGEAWGVHESDGVIPPAMMERTPGSFREEVR